ncbi:hypothetical protein [Micromonospora sp. NPDC048842]|uniref:hypothetical protein n=1 Tax=unclassified Micromonospora TaxID=2617518 RepID=UPI00340485C2
MPTPEANDALRWLAEQGVTPLGEGRWLESTSSSDIERSDNDLAHEWSAAALGDDRLASVQRLRTGLGLLDLLDEYWVPCAGSDTGPVRLSSYLR